SALRAASIAEVFPTARGDFLARMLQIDLTRLWMSRGEESLPSTARLVDGPARTIIFFLASSSELPIRSGGIDISPNEIVLGSKEPSFRRTFGPHHYSAMSLTPADLLAAARVQADCELGVPLVDQIFRPEPTLMACLQRLHSEAVKLAEKAPDKLANP